MKHNLRSLPEHWLAALGGVDASGWVTAFLNDPDAAVSDLLWNRFYFGSLNPTERGKLLSTWLESLGDSEGFRDLLDAALARWVLRNWGRFNQPASLLSSAWTTLIDIVAFSGRLDEGHRLSETAQALRARFVERQEFLGSFSTAPASDPSGAFLGAIAEFQGEDRSLTFFWHRLCDLPDGVPFYHARYALLGLRRLAPADPAQRGTLRAEIVVGCLRLGDALDRLIRERGLSDTLARSTFERTARQLAAAYPDSPRWVEHGLARVLEMPERPKRWVLTAIRPLASAVQAIERPGARARPRRSIEANPTWPKRAQALAKALGRKPSTITAVIELLDEQRRYAALSGEVFYLTRSLCNFSSRILPFQPALAARWAEEARTADPRDAFAWMASKDALLKLQKPDGAFRLLWIAYRRFPENVVVRSSLADALKIAGRFEEAEFVYREALSFLPPDGGGVEYQIPRSGLADVLKSAKRFDEAEAEYRSVLKQFPDSDYAWSGLGNTLHRAGRWEESEKIYREAMSKGYATSAICIDFANLLIRKGESARGEALELLQQALLIEPYSESATKLAKKLRVGTAADLQAITAEWEQVAHELPIDFSTVGDLTSAPRPATTTPDQLSEEVGALISEARFYRTWAGDLESEVGAERRNKAALLLAQAASLSPDHPLVMAETAALQWSEGKRQEASELLHARLKLTPSVAPLLTLKARFDRAQAQAEGRLLTDATLSELLEAPRQLRNLDMTLAPLFDLQKGIAALSLVDGASRVEAAAQAFSQFRTVLALRAGAQRGAQSENRPLSQTARFHKWVLMAADRNLFVGVQQPDLVRAEEVAPIEEHLMRHGAMVHQIEDFLIDHASFMTGG